MSACLALGYQSRLLVAADTASWSYIHLWPEDYYNGTRVHVEPSDKTWKTLSDTIVGTWTVQFGRRLKSSGLKTALIKTNSYVQFTLEANSL